MATPEQRAERPIAILYENEAWMAPLFEALDREAAPYERVFANDRIFDPTEPAPSWSLAVNKISPSSYLRGHSASIAFARQFLPFLEERGVPVVNGSDAFRLETSKAFQLLLLHRLGIRAPAAHVISDASHVRQAARGLRYPLIVKPNVGGSGALARRFDDPAELDEVADLDLGPDGTALVQEYLEPADGAIVRVEFLNGEFLYAIRIWAQGDGDFNLCPADICQAPGAEIVSGAVNELTTKKQMRIEAFDPPAEMIDAVLRIARAGRLDVGGVEYLVAARDGLPYVYDINALSNFVTDAQSLVGFDPYERFARYLVARAGIPIAA